MQKLQAIAFVKQNGNRDLSLGTLDGAVFAQATNFNLVRVDGNTENFGRHAEGLFDEGRFKVDEFTALFANEVMMMVAIDVGQFESAVVALTNFGQLTQLLEEVDVTIDRGWVYALGAEAIEELRTTHGATRFEHPKHRQAGRASPLTTGLKLFDKLSFVRAIASLFAWRTHS